MQQNNRYAVVMLIIVAAVMLCASAAFAANSATAPQYIVRAVAVEGLKSVPEKTVTDQVTKTVIGGQFSEDDAMEDMKSIMSTGFFTNVEASLTSQGDGVKVTFIVVENDKVNSIRIETSLLEPEVIRGYIRQKEGEALNDRLLQEDLQNLQERIIEDHGYVMRPTDVSLTEQGDVVIVITPARVSKIVIEGNVETKEKVITRELSTRAGDYLNMDVLGNDLHRLWQLGFFEEITPDFLDGETPDSIIVKITVVERKNGLFSFGGGYSTADGLLGYLEYADENFLGRGENISIRSEFAQKKVSYDLGFQEPYLFGGRTSFGASLFNRTSAKSRLESDDSAPSDYTEWQQGGELALGRPLGDFTNASVKLVVEDTTITPKEGSSITASQSKTRSVTLQTNTDTTYDPYYPTSGMRLNLSMESAGLFLGGDTAFAKYVAQHSRYIKVGRNDQVLAFQLVGGVANAPGTLPLQEEFKVGGADTLRGYKYGEMHGDSMVYLNTEYRFKLSKELQAAVFVDGGQAWNKADGTPSGLKIGYGLGLRIQTPLGIMRLDYGIGEKGGQMYFSLGPSF